MRIQNKDFKKAKKILKEEKEEKNFIKCNCCERNDYIKDEYFKKNYEYDNYDRKGYLKYIYRFKPKDDKNITSATLKKKRNIIYRVIILPGETSNSKKEYKKYQKPLPEIEHNISC